MPFRGSILPVTGRRFHVRYGRRNGKTAAAGRCPQTRGAGCRGRRYSHAVSRRYFHARFGAIFLCRFGAAKRHNGRAGVPTANKGRGLPGEEIFSCRFAAVFSCRFAAVFSCRFGAVFSCCFGAIFLCRFGAAKRQNGRAGVPPANKGRGLPKEAGFSSAASPASKGRGRPGEGAGFPGAPVRCPQTRGAGGRGSMTFRRGEDRPQARGAGGRERGLIFRAAKIARERPSFGQKSQKKSENRASFV